MRSRRGEKSGPPVLLVHGGAGMKQMGDQRRSRATTELMPCGVMHPGLRRAILCGFPPDSSGHADVR
ncbi:hypothetical protein [Desulfuromonas sp. TF]|uniref:hypothetical protein n=1 Tax=Desulfuromonas sp. TF TaxID=1232410 RepID=UPI0012DD2E81|nr:hypothetical protein [Desulfuromonas sp. TF]